MKAENKEIEEKNEREEHENRCAELILESILYLGISGFDEISIFLSECRKRIVDMLMNGHGKKDV